MAGAPARELMDPQRDGGRVRAEVSRSMAEMPDMSAERFAGKAWLIGDVDTQSFRDAVVAIERLCEVRFTRPHHLSDPAAFDW